MSIKRDRRPIAELKVMTCPPFNSGALLTYGRKTFYYRINAYVYFSEECKLHTIRLERAVRDKSAPTAVDISRVER